MAKTKSKAKKKKTMEEKKLDAQLAIGKRLAGIEKLIDERFPVKENDMDLEIDDDDEGDGDDF